MLKNFKSELNAEEEEIASNLFSNQTLQSDGDVAIMIPLAHLEQVELYENYFTEETDIQKEK